MKQPVRDAPVHHSVRVPLKIGLHQGAGRRSDSEHVQSRVSRFCSSPMSGKRNSRTSTRSPEKFYGKNHRYEECGFFPRKSPCRKRSPAKGVWQKSDEKSVRSIRKVTESVPKTKKSDRTSFAALLLRHPEENL